MAQNRSPSQKINMVHNNNNNLEIDPAVQRFLEAHRHQIESYGEFSDNVLTDSGRVVKSILHDVKELRRKSITALKKDVDFVYYEVASKVKRQGPQGGSRS